MTLNEEKFWDPSEVGILFENLSKKTPAIGSTNKINVRMKLNMLHFLFGTKFKIAKF